MHRACTIEGYYTTPEARMNSLGSEASRRDQFWTSHKLNATHYETLRGITTFHWTIDFIDKYIYLCVYIFIYLSLVRGLSVQYLCHEQRRLVKAGLQVCKLNEPFEYEIQESFRVVRPRLYRDVGLRLGITVGI